MGRWNGRIWEINGNAIYFVVLCNSNIFSTTCFQRFARILIILIIPIFVDGTMLWGSKFICYPYRLIFYFFISYPSQPVPSGQWQSVKLESFSSLAIVSMGTSLSHFLTWTWRLACPLKARHFSYHFQCPKGLYLSGVSMRCPQHHFWGMPHWESICYSLPPGV